MRFIWLSLMLNIGLFTRSGPPVGRGHWRGRRTWPGRAGSCPERGSERQACARPRRAGRPPRPAAASAGLRRGFDLGSSPRPAVPNLVGTRDRRSQENLLPGDLGRAEEAMLGLGSGRKCRWRFARWGHSPPAGSWQAADRYQSAARDWGPPISTIRHHVANSSLHPWVPSGTRKAGGRAQRRDGRRSLWRPGSRLQASRWPRPPGHQLKQRLTWPYNDDRKSNCRWNTSCRSRPSPHRLFPGPGIRFGAPRCLWFLSPHPGSSEIRGRPFTFI